MAADDQALPWFGHKSPKGPCIKALAPPVGGNQVSAPCHGMLPTVTEKPTRDWKPKQMHSNRNLGNHPN